MEAGSVKEKDRCRKGVNQWARETDQVALGAGSLGGRTEGPRPTSCDDKLSREAIEAVCQGTMMGEDEWHMGSNKEEEKQSEVNIDSVVGGLTMVEKMAAFGGLDLVENHVENGGLARGNLRRISAGNWGTGELCLTIGRRRNCTSFTVCLRNIRKHKACHHFASKC